MKVLKGAVLLTFLLGCAGVTWGMFVRIDTQAVPIDRVLSNLEARLAKDPRNVELLYQIGRIHSMAYSTNLATIEIVTNPTANSGEPFFGHLDNGVPWKVYKSTNAQAQLAARRHLTNAIAYYQKAAALVEKGTNANNKWVSLPIHLGLAWTIDQDGRREEAIKGYRKALQLSWSMEIDQRPTIKEQLEWSWDQTRARHSPFTKPPDRTSVGLYCFSEEIISYLLKLLDPVKDAKEIAQLKADQAVIQKMGRAITPILVPLMTEVSFEELINPAANVSFDLDGSGLPRRWGWITPKAAWLVYDHGGHGRITSGLQMFGSVTFWIFWRDGYEALSSLDDNADGKLCGAELKGLSLWQDCNGNGIADAGEVRPLTDYEIVSINCRGETHSDGIPYSPQGVAFRDGNTRPTYDWIVPSAAICKPVEP